MPKMIRARNDGTITQTVVANGNWIRVVPGGTVLLQEGSPFLGVAGFTAVGAEAVAGRQDQADVQNDEVAALQAQVAQLMQLVAGLSAKTDVEYPHNLGGGKWRLSDGTETKGGTSRVIAEELEAALHANDDPALSE